MTMVFFDLETSDLPPNWPPKSAIIQIAALAVTTPDLVVVDQFECKVRFKVSNANPDSLTVNSYDKEVWDSEAVHPRDAVVALDAWLKTHANTYISGRTGREYPAAQLVGHNIVGFDHPFLEKWWDALRNAGDAPRYMPVYFQSIDTQVMAAEVQAYHGFLFPRLRLQDIADHYGLLDGEQSHDALDDVRLNLQVYKALREHNNGGAK